MKKISVWAAFLSLACCTAAFAGLPEYDAAIAADHAGALPYAAALTSAVDLDGEVGEPFDFGSITDSATFEFILEGDPNRAADAGGRNGYLAVGEADPTNSLRYEQWDDTGTLGFTKGGVADNDLGVPSPTSQTHIAYRWDAVGDGTGTMDLYVGGVLAGTVADATFAMPTGPGLLGANLADPPAEQMLGTIHRITTYDIALDPGVISAHAATVPEPSIMALVVGGFLTLLAGYRRKRG